MVFSDCVVFYGNVCGVKLSVGKNEALDDGLVSGLQRIW